jgi:nuclear pore complex protein Nup53
MPYRKPSSKDFWITVFGFPQTAVSLILSHFSQCGTIIDKILPTQNGNWIHLKFTSRLECDKALNYNCKIICNNLMIGVIHCNDESVVDKENNDGRE